MIMIIIYLKWKSIDWFVSETSSLLEGISRKTIKKYSKLLKTSVPRPDISPSRYRNICFLDALWRLVVIRPNLEVATKRILYLQVKIPG